MEILSVYEDFETIRLQSANAKNISKAPFEVKNNKCENNIYEYL